MKCFYHGVDFDGRCSAYWVNKCVKVTDGYGKKFYPINYGMSFPLEEIFPDEEVYIVDYSIMPEEMEQLLQITKNIIWIDHHISAIKRYDNFPHTIKGIRMNGIAACMLTWFWFHGKFDLTTTPLETNMIFAPMFTKYIGDYDVWKFEYEDTKAFQMGLQLYDTNSIDTSSIFEALNCSYNKVDLEREIITKGQDLLTYRDNWAKEYCEHVGFETDFEGYKCYAMNMAMISSEHFKSINEENYDMLIGFSFNGTIWKYELRSTKVDCSKIAMKYGGGGHKGAAGFSSPELLLFKVEGAKDE